MHRHARHLLAAFGAFTTDRDAVFHTADALAIGGAGFADFGADFAGTVVETGIHRHEVGRQLANLGATHHQTEVLGLDVPPAHFQTLIHGRLQTDLSTAVTNVNA